MSRFRISPKPKGGRRRSSPLSGEVVTRPRTGHVATTEGRSAVWTSRKLRAPDSNAGNPHLPEWPSGQELPRVRGSDAQDPRSHGFGDDGQVGVLEEQVVAVHGSTRRPAPAGRPTGRDGAPPRRASRLRSRRPGGFPGQPATRGCPCPAQHGPSPDPAPGRVGRPATCRANGAARRDPRWRAKTSPELRGRRPPVG